MLPLWRASALRMARGASASSSTSAISALANGAGGELHASVASVSRRLAAASLSTALGRCVPLLDVNQHALMTARSATAPLAYSTAAAAPQPEAPEPKVPRLLLDSYSTLWCHVAFAVISLVKTIDDDQFQVQGVQQSDERDDEQARVRKGRRHHSVQALR